MKKFLNPKSSQFWLVACIVFGLILRILYQLCYSNNFVFFSAPVGEGRTFLNLSRDLTYLKIFNPELLFSSPVYLIFLDVFRFFAGTFKAVYIVQSILGLLNIYLIFSITRNLFSGKVGILSSWIYVLTPVFLFYESKVSPLLPGITTILLIILLIQNIHKKNNFLAYCILGLLSGLIINIYSFTLFILIACLFALLILAPGYILINRVRIVFTLFFFALSCLPIMIWFRMIAGEHQFFPNKLGLQFFAQNSLPEENNTFTEAVSDMDSAALKKLLLMAEKDEKNIVKFNHIDKHFALKRLKSMANNPASYLSNSSKKIIDLFSLKENTGTKSFAYENAGCPVFCILFISCALLLVLGFIGMALVKINRPIKLFLGIYVLICFLSFIFLDSSAELRSFITIALIPFSSCILFDSIRLVNYSGYKKYLRLTVLIISAFFMILFQNTKYTPVDKVQYFFNNALAYEYLDDLPSAVSWYQIAIRHDPDNIYIIKKASIAALKGLKYSDAELFINKGLEILPDSSSLHNNLGLVHLNTGNLSQAKKEFLIVLKNNPKDSWALFNLGLVSKNLDETDEAIIYLKKISRKSSIYPQSIQLLAKIYQESGSFKKAKAYYRELKLLFPNNPFFGFKIDQMNKLDKNTYGKN